MSSCISSAHFRSDWGAISVLSPFSQLETFVSSKKSFQDYWVGSQQMFHKNLLWSELLITWWNAHKHGHTFTNWKKLMSGVLWLVFQNLILWEDRDKMVFDGIIQNLAQPMANGVFVGGGKLHLQRENKGVGIYNIIRLSSPAKGSVS